MKNNYSNGPLMAVDALGRALSDISCAPGKREGKLVGIFYFIWLGEHGRHRPYDISKIVAENPNAGFDLRPEVWGRIGAYHHWGEPLYGYYYSTDEWVVRRHMKLLIEADIDFLFFDTTNAVIYEDNAKLVMSILDEYRREGFKIPKVMFYTNTRSGETVERIYNAIYKENYCPETWFCERGKPVIVGNYEDCQPFLRRYFRIKPAQWPNEADKPGGWPWMDFTRPQRVFLDDDGNRETMSVSVAQHPQIKMGDSVLYGEKSNRGRGYHNGENDLDPEAYKHGYNFAEQWEWALKIDPRIVLVTGWNEWVAGRWNGKPERPIMFVDCANYEYSRDIEMMRGGYFDNYLMQLADYVRRFKGVEENKTFEDHELAEYYNFSDGDFSRNCEGSGTVYTNYTQRNAINKIDIVSDNEYLTFTIHTKGEIDENRDGTWMKIYINTGKGVNYDFVLNNTPCANGETTLAKIDEKFNATDIARAKYTVCGNKLEIKVKKEALGLSSDFDIWFKVADSREEICSFEDFYINGDVAPLGRWNYVYRVQNKDKTERT